MRVYLEFLPEQGNTQRARLGYAFSLFCAIYGHRKISTAEAYSADVWISYCPENTKPTPKPTLRLANLYKPRSVYEPAPPPRTFERDRERTFLFYSPISSGEPDWLAEVFEWVSCADEYSIQRRDSAGRIDFRDSYAGRHRLDIGVPYAAVAMRYLHNALCKCIPGQAFEQKYDSGWSTHFLINTHDVDILPAGYLGSLRRLLKYALISMLVFKSVKHAAVQTAQALSMAAGGANPLDQMPNLVRTELRNGLGATYFFIARHDHRRDANYRITDPDVEILLESVARQGMEVALHGSYNSLDYPESLASEFSTLREQGLQPLGNRQHWLRFTLDRLIPAVERSGALYDSSLGWNTIGFRAGACFPFPPYNFDCERPATFLEIPLAVMDQGPLRGGRPEKAWFDDIARILSNSRRYGWGGLSLLWHPTAFGGGQLPREIERVFQRLVEHREEWNDTWISCIDLVRSVYRRYVNVDLLPQEYGSDIFSDETYADLLKSPVRENVLRPAAAELVE
jgi:hypothetical protein